MKNFFSNHPYVTIAIVVCAIMLAVIKYDFYMCDNYNSGTCPRCHCQYETTEYLYRGNSWVGYKCPECGKMGDVPKFLT